MPRQKGDAWDARILFCGVALLTLLAATFPLIVLPGVVDDSDVLPKVLVTRAVVLLLGLLLLARVLVTREVRLRRTPLDLPVLAIVASAALSTVLSVNPTLSIVGGYARYEGLVTIATYAGLFWLGAQFITEPRRARLLLRAMLAGASVECVLACWQALATSLGADLNVFGERSTIFGGVARAFGTMANPNNLAIWLAMLIPVGLYETISARALRGRALAAAVTLLMTVTIVITFGRSAWIGALCGVLLTAVLCARRVDSRRALIVAAGSVVVAAGVLAAAGAITERLGVPFFGPVSQRLSSLADPGSGTGGVRLHFYADTVRMVAQRPLVGYGPDTFGLVYPSHTTGDWTPGEIVDKAHSDILQVAASQGELGAAADVWLLVMLARMLLHKRNAPGVAAVAGGVLAYQLAIQLNFAWFPVTAPFWILLVACVALSRSGRPIQRTFSWNLPLRALGLGAGVAAVIAAVYAFSVRPALANAHYAQSLAAWSAGHRMVALQRVTEARNDDAAMSEYAAFQGDLEDDVAGQRPGPDADLRAARDAYEHALADGDIYPNVAIRLAYVDIALGDRAAALNVARSASALDPYGLATKLVSELGG